MRIFVYEWTGVTDSFLAAALRKEGRAMLAAIREDLQRIPGIDIITMESAGEHSSKVEKTEFTKLAKSADLALVIAPELGQILSTRCRWVINSGGCLLGSQPEAVLLTGDKWALGRHLQQHHLPTPESFVVSLEKPFPKIPFPLVWKPRFGAGSHATYLVGNAARWSRCQIQARLEGWKGQSIIQPFAPGVAASVSFLIGPKQTMSLLPAAQTLSEDGRFHYQGGRMPLPRPLWKRAQRIARQAVQCIPGLRGYIGVDVVLGNDKNGSQDVIIEINPRLTTSYLGLRAMTKANLAARMLAIFWGKETVAPRWRSGEICFYPDGALVELQGTGCLPKNARRPC